VQWWISPLWFFAGCLPGRIQGGGLIIPHL
jgi:hypothetical protein